MQGSRIFAGSQEQHISKHEKQRRSSAHKQREKHPRNPNSARRERSSSSDKSRKGEATRQSKGKIARIQVEQIENRLRNHTRTHARTRKNTGSSLTFLSLHSRSPSGARVGESILPVDPRSEQTGKYLKGWLRSKCERKIFKFRGTQYTSKSSRCELATIVEKRIH